jgi:hypothetical protein
MSYPRFSVVLDHPVAFESLYGRYYSKCSSAFVIMGGSWKSKTSMRKNSNYVPDLPWKTLGLFPYCLVQRCCVMVFIKPLLAAWYVHPNPV